MNHYAPRQREDNKKWHYTCKNDDRIWPVGYCGPYKTCPTCEGSMVVDGEPCPDCKTRVGISTGVIRMPEEERCPGHDTPEEAREHYKQYLLDKRTHEATYGEWHGCVICDTPTKAGFEVGTMRGYPLCDEHRTREHLEPLVIVGDSLSSY